MEIQAISEAALPVLLSELLVTAGETGAVGFTCEAHLPHLVDMVITRAGIVLPDAYKQEAYLPHRVRLYIEARGGTPVGPPQEAYRPPLLVQAITLAGGADPGTRTEAEVPGLWFYWAAAVLEGADPAADGVLTFQGSELTWNGRPVTFNP